MATTVRVYAGQELAIELCGKTNVTVTAPGIPATVVRGAASSCDVCADKTFAFNNTNTLDYKLTPKDTPCGAFDPIINTVSYPPQWVDGKPVVTCVSNCSTNHLVGGDIVVDPVSFMASLQIPTGIGNPSQHFCGGSLIMEGIILTAAHCVEGDLVNGHGSPGMSTLILQRCSNPQCITAVVGVIADNVPENDASRLTVVDWAAHPLYDKATFAHDVGLVRVSGVYNYSKTQFSLGPWSNPPQNLPIPINSNLAVLGWGVDESGGLSQRLRNATMPYVPHAACAKVCIISISIYY